MGKLFPEIDADHRAFIEAQQIFFVASAADGAHINLTPRSTDMLRVIDAQSVCYLDFTGSSNETAAHLLADGRMTMMLCAFAGPPKIMRLYGRARVLHRQSEEFAAMLAAHYGKAAPHGTRQIVLMDVTSVKTSCGYGVPHFAYKGERPALANWTRAKTPEQIEDYWRKNNVVSMDGAPTGIFDA
jgi:hypothetical protein